MKPADLLRRARNEVGLAQMLPFTHLVSADVFGCKGGMFGATLKITGISYLTADNKTLNQFGLIWHQALTQIDERFMVYVHLHRSKKPLSLSGEFTDQFAKQVNDKYQAQFNNKPLFQNDIYLTLILKGDDTTKAARGLNLMKRISAHLNPKTLIALEAEQKLIALSAQMEQLQSQIAAFGPMRLDSSELLGFLALLINGNKQISFPPATYAAPIAKSFAETIKAEIQYPEGHLGYYLSSNGIYFGDCIQFQGSTNADCNFGAILSIKQYGRETAHLIFDPLHAIDSECLSTHTFAPLPRDAALKEITLKRNKLINAEDLGQSQIAELEVLEDAIASSNARLGFHHHTLLLLADSKEALENNILEAVKLYANAGITVIRETLNQEAAFFAQFPGNQHWITRSSLITSHNFSDFCPLHNQAPGFASGNHLQSPVTLLQTPAKTPVYFNFHTKGGSASNPAPGHTAVFGATNAGKNTLIGFLDTQMHRFKHRSFFIDRDSAFKIHVLAHENSSYTVIAPNNCVPMNPFQLPDTPVNRSFLASFLNKLVKHPGELDIPSAISEQLNACVHYAYESLDKHCRKLAHIVKFLSRDFARWPELNRFLQGNDSREAGEFAWLFDNDTDALNFNFDKVGFDVTWLMDEASPLIATPVYLYLLHRMRSCLDGRLTAFIIDEAHQVFASNFWVKVLGSWTPTIRKLNGFFIFMTQSPETLINSSIAHVMLANVVTTIIFPNADANPKTYQEGLGLSNAEFQLVKNINPLSRQFLYRQRGESSMLCQLDLSELSEEIRVFSANKKSVDLLNGIFAAHGDNPRPADWLPEFLEKSAL